MTLIRNMNRWIPLVEDIIPQEMLKAIAKNGTDARKIWHCTTCPYLGSFAVSHKC